MKYQIGNIVQEVQSGIILQQCNAQGVQNSGVAKEIRAKYPIVWDDYSKTIEPNPIFQESRARLGRIVVSEVSDSLLVVCIISQQFYGKDGKRYTSYDALDTALETLERTIKVYGSGRDDTSVHHPLIGCGLGGGHWNVVKEIIEHRLGSGTTLWTLK
jgi:O-acetyl-ADP-ribose deacetylase (regulator of RNase III)